MIIISNENSVFYNSGQFDHNRTIKHLDVVPHFDTLLYLPDVVFDNSVFNSPEFNNRVVRSAPRDSGNLYFYRDLLQFVCIDFNMFRNCGHNFLIPTSEPNVIISYTTFTAYPSNVRRKFQAVFRIQIMDREVSDQGLLGPFKPTKKTNYRLVTFREKTIFQILFYWLIVFVTFGFILFNSSFREDLFSKETICNRCYYDYNRYFFLRDKSKCGMKLSFSLFGRKENGDANVLLSKHKIHVI